MNLSHLAIFQAVAECGSVTRGAGRLSISQPAVSKQLKQFERSLGVALLDRQPRGVRLTDHGRVLAEYATRLFAVADEAERAIRDVSFVRHGRVSIGVTPTLGASLMPEVLVHFRRRFPAIEAQVEIARPAVLSTLVRDGVVDLVVSDAALDGDADRCVFAHETLVVIAPFGHAIAKRRTVPLTMLSGVPFVMREAGDATRVYTEAALAAHGITLRVAMTIASTEAVKRAVSAGLGLAIVPALSVADDVAAKRLSIVRVSGLSLRRPVYVTTPRGRRESKSATAFLCLLKHGFRRSLPTLKTPAAFV